MMSPMRLPRLLRRRRAESGPPAGAAQAAEPQVVQLDATQLTELSAVFSAPRWLRDLGFASWLVLGVAAMLLALVWLLGLTATIVGPVLAAFVVATVASPGVAWLERRHVPRAVGAGLVLLAVVAAGIIVVLLVIGGIVSQGDQISAESTAAANHVRGWLTDLGLNASGADTTTSDVSSAVPDVIGALAGGAIDVVQGLASMAFALSFAVFSLFFLLKDGPQMRAAVERQMGVPLPVARTVTGGVLLSLRRYFGGAPSSRRSTASWWASAPCCWGYRSPGRSPLSPSSPRTSRSSARSWRGRLRSCWPWGRAAPTPRS